ncbi:MAG: tagatose 1,6-diphosphate aldolase [Acidobacteria bacterium]|nr:tagatose 1,6-diphosphate aldolase [Acidobacteriota bacterium]
MKLTPGKLKGLQAVADSRGVIAAAAMDQRGALRKPISKAAGIAPEQVTHQQMAEFKTAVARVLTPYASAILLDPEYGLEAARTRHKNAGLLLAYEKSGYDNTQPGRRPDLLPNISARRLKEMGADAVKVLIYYTPYEDAAINDAKHAFIERIGAECAAVDIPYFLEFVGYDPAGGDEKGFEYSRKKPDIVARSMAEFSKDRYQVDVLKVEVPVNLAFAEGATSYTGPAAYTRKEALERYRAAAAVARRPFIYLSAGVSNEQYTESLRWAAEAGVNFSGVLCGRATWKDGVPVYAKKGVAALEDWLRGEGVANIEAVNRCLEAAKPWFGFYGAKSALELAA